MALTGKFTFRKSLRGKIILQVEEELKALWRRSGQSPLRRRWRDATLMDLAAPELRGLIDLRFRPQFRVPGQGPESPRTDQRRAVPGEFLEAFPGVPRVFKLENLFERGIREWFRRKKGDRPAGGQGDEEGHEK